MNILHRLVCVLAFVLPTAPTQAQENYPEFEAIYKAKVKILGGKVRLSTRQESPGAYVFEYSVIPGGFVRMFTKGNLKETAHFTLADRRPRVNHYILENTIGSNPRNGEVRFDWERNVVTGNYKEFMIDMPIPENAVDRAMFQIVLMADLQQDNVRDTYSVYTKDEFLSISVERIGKETIKVGTGTYATEILQHTSPDGDSVTKLWCAPELGYLPVRIEAYDEGSRVLSANLEELTGLPASFP